MSSSSNAFKHNSSTVSNPQPQLRLSLNVPAEVVLTPLLTLNKDRSNIGGKGPPQGHYSQMLKPLAQPGMVLKHWSRIYRHLVAALGTVKRARMVEEVLRCQAVYGKAFPSARFLAEGALADEKTWDRTLELLRERGWVETRRCHRGDGTLSVNLIDLRRLWALILKLLASAGARVEWLQGTLWAKVHGAWQTVEVEVPLAPDRLRLD